MLKLNVGLSRKIGEANFGSRGASVNLELEVESTLAGDPQSLQDRIRSLFRLARASVDEELGSNGHSPNGQNTNGQSTYGHGNGDHATGHANGSYQNGNGNGANSNGSSNGSRQSNGRPATASQVRAIHAIAKRQQIDLPSELRNRFGVYRVDELSLSDASAFIDAIKQPADGSGARR